MKSNNDKCQMPAIMFACDASKSTVVKNNETKGVFF